jgi:hypothetical protein
MTVIASGRGLTIGRVIAISGGLAALAGAGLPWESIDSRLVQTADAASTQIGFDFDNGKIFVLVAFVAIISSAARLFAGRLPANAVATVARLLGTGAGIAVLGGAMIASLAVLDLNDIANNVDAINAAVSGGASIGLGIYVDLAGGVVMLVGGGIGLLLGRQ